MVGGVDVYCFRLPCFNSVVLYLFDVWVFSYGLDVVFVACTSGFGVYCFIVGFGDLFVH